MAFRRIAPLVAVMTTVLAALVGLRRFGGVMRSWGATADETQRALPGDSYAASPRDRRTMAITIDAAPKYVWPWLVQLGRGRGGLYSYDWLDRLFSVLDAPSATRVLPEFQHLEAGDTVPIGKVGGFPVLEVKPGHHLVLGGGDPEWVVAWAFILEPHDGGRTRLISRYQANYPPTIRNCIFSAALGPAAFIMTRRMLLNLKARAEALAEAEAQAEAQAA